jgi:transposase
MAVSTPNQYPVVLEPEQRECFEAIVRNGYSSAKKIRRAQVLLLSDADRPEGRLTRDQIAERLDMHVNTVDRVRKRFVLEGEQPALNRKPRLTPPVPAKIDGHVEAHLVALCCSKAPEGRTRWTLQLLADELKQRGFVTSICIETVRRALKKTNCSLGARSAGAFRNATRRGSSPKWKTSSTFMPKNTRPKNR